MEDLDLLDEVLSRNVASYRSSKSSVQSSLSLDSALIENITVGIKTKKEKGKGKKAALIDIQGSSVKLFEENTQLSIEERNLSVLNIALSDEVTLLTNPGIGHFKRSIIKADDADGIYKASFVSEEKVDEFKALCSKGFYIVKKWLKPEVDSLVKQLNMPLRVKLLWKKVYFEVVKGQAVTKAAKVNLTYKAIFMLYVIRSAKAIRSKMSALDKKTHKVVMQKRKIEAYEQKLLIAQLKHSKKVEADWNNIQLEYKSVDAILRKAKKEQDRAAAAQKYLFRFEEAKLQSAAMLNDLRKLRVKKTVQLATRDEKWFGFLKNDHLVFLQKLTSTPDWLLELKDETELKPDQYFEALVSVLRICNITCSRQGFYMVNKLVGGTKKVGIAEFRRTFNRIFKFHKESELKIEAYTLTVSYLSKMLNCKTAFRNIHYLTSKTYTVSEKVLPESSC